jgi:hypothetical protein
MKRSRSDKSGLPADYLEPLVAALGDPAVLAGVRAEELEAVAFQLALYFGVRHDPATAAVLGGIYERLVEYVPAEDRQALVDELAVSVRGGASSVLALLPILQRERDAAVARAAALAMATHMPAAEGDPLTGPRALRALFEHTEEDAVRAGLVGALLALGDRRVRPLLDGLWRSLSPAACAALLGLSRARASVLEADWLLDWLEDAAPADSGQVAGSLARLAVDGDHRLLDLEREWPAGAAGEAFTVLREWTLAEAGAKFAPRLRDLARRVEPAGAMAAVLRAWGVPD